ncbi:MAG TPA: LCP family protein [Microbacteriaceae bacterium]|jgi:LCP family protein required for cell wall assembly|nr:LCP family protein [Microbacteriaceae bacterium]HPZ34649.1 LCP family protein [Microbacteriaceae bacterium]
MSQATPPSPRRRRHTVARHGQLRSPHPLAQIGKFFAMALAVVLVSGVSVAGFAAWDLAHSFASEAVEIPQDAPLPPNIGEIEGGVNLLLTGTDKCEPEYAAYFGERCTGPDSGGELNDVTMLLHISEEPRRVTVISFPRDMIVRIPSCTDEKGRVHSAMSGQMLNTTYAYGGLACTALTVSELTGQPIQFAASITWGGVIEVSNAIGGVPVCIVGGIRDRYTGLDLAAGDHELSGLTALQFLRTRHGVGDGGDLGRISNQQQFMSSLARKLVGDGVLSDPKTLYELANVALESVTPSKSLANPVLMMQIALAVKNVPFDEIVFLQYPTSPDPSDPNRVRPNTKAADVLFAALAENAPIELTNTASAGAGVVVVEPSTAPGEPGAVPEPGASGDPGTTPEPGAPEAPASGAVQLPSSISGTTAAQITCSNGNLRGRG